MSLFNQRVNGSKTLLRSARQHFYPIVSSSRDRLSWKTSLLSDLKSEDCLLNTLTKNDKYCRYNRESFPQPIQMQLSKKVKLFSTFSFYFWNLYQILNIMKRK